MPGGAAGRQGPQRRRACPQDKAGSRTQAHLASLEQTPTAELSGGRRAAPSGIPLCKGDLGGWTSATAAVLLFPAEIHLRRVIIIEAGEAQSAFVIAAVVAADGLDQAFGRKEGQ